MDKIKTTPTPITIETKKMIYSIKSKFPNVQIRDIVQVAVKRLLADPHLDSYFEGADK